MRPMLAVAILVFSSTTAFAQIPANLLRQGSTTFLPVPGTVSLAGPRFGLTSLAPGVITKLREREIEVSPLISQFGWQFERQFYSRDSGVTAVSEWVALIGGMDQGVVLPSLSWVVGVRTKEGAEFGIGPNITPAGVGLVLTGGVTIRTGALNVPVNVALVPSRYGTRLTVLTGFNMRQR